MSSTNKTTNYNLSQFIGSDKPAWLQDYNSDMNKIDTGIKTAADTATSASGSASAATTAIGDLTNLTTTDKTNLVSAVNEVDGNADTAQNTANNAYNATVTNATAISALTNYLNLNTFTTPTINISGGTINNSVTDMNCASNNTGSLGKIYGRIGYVSSGSSSTISFNTPLRPDTAITVNGIALSQWSDSGNPSDWSNLAPISINIGTDGVATTTISGSINGRQRMIIFSACLIFAKSFGDTPLPE